MQISRTILTLATFAVTSSPIGPTPTHASGSPKNAAPSAPSAPRVMAVHGPSVGGLEAGQSLQIGQTVSVDSSPGSSVLIGFPDPAQPGSAPLPGHGLRTVALLKSGAEAIVRKTPAGAWQLELKTGSVLAHTDPVSTKEKQAPSVKGPRFTVKTRAATMGVRGTTFFVRDDGKSPLFFCPCEGKVEVTAAAKTEPRLFESKHHEARAYIEPETGAITPTTDGEGHTDEEIEGLKSQFQVK